MQRSRQHKYETHSSQESSPKVLCKSKIEKSVCKIHRKHCRAWTNSTGHVYVWTAHLCTSTSSIQNTDKSPPTSTAHEYFTFIINGKIPSAFHCQWTKWHRKFHVLETTWSFEDLTFTFIVCLAYNHMLQLSHNSTANHDCSLTFM